jgi:uracil phosphoribosyltransferase
MGTVHVMDHPLILHKLSLMRDSQTGVKEFREATREVAMLMCYEATRDLPLKTIQIETPLARAKARVISGKKLAFIPILRAGLGMIDGMLELIPTAKVGHLGLYRDPDTMKPVEYYCKLPVDVAERDVIVIDPMVATGGSATAAVQTLKDRGVKHIKLMCLLATLVGLETVQKAHPDVDIFVAAIDEGLNDHGYIVPGLGDAGDRIFGTK